MFTFLTSSNVLAIPRPNIAGLKSTLVSVEWMQTVEHLHKPEESKQQEVSECTTAARVLPLPYTRDKSNDFLVQSGTTRYLHNDLRRPVPNAAFNKASKSNDRWFHPLVNFKGMLTYCLVILVLLCEFVNCNFLLIRSVSITSTSMAVYLSKFFN